MTKHLTMVRKTSSTAFVPKYLIYGAVLEMPMHGAKDSALRRQDLFQPFVHPIFCEACG